jgi:aspartate aminotransferase
MPRKLAERLSSVAPSATLAMMAQASRLRAEGHRVYDFSVGEPDFDTPLHVRSAAKAALDVGTTHYTPVGGTRELRSAICAATERQRGYRPTPSEVVVSSGSKQALFNLALALFDRGDEVVIPAPYWTTFPAQVKMVGATPVFVPTVEASGFRVSASDLAAAITPRTKAVLLCIPSNPTGATYAEEHLLPLVALLRQKDVWIIIDEIYADLTYGSTAYVSLPSLAEDLRDRIAVVDGVSTAYAMTGWRVGWAIAPAALCAALEVLQGQTAMHASAVSQAAAVAALNGPRDEVDAMRAAFARRRDLMVDGLNATSGMSCRMVEAAFYAFADVRGLYGITWQGRRLSSDEDVAAWLLEVAHVVGVPGAAFGAPGYVRFSYACSEEDIEGGLVAMRSAIASHT